MEATPADASTLIYIAKADAFEEVAQCVSPLLIPPAVWREAVSEGERIGALEVPRIRTAESAGSIVRTNLSAEEKRAAGAIAGQHRLGSGESEVIAIGTRFGRVIVDEGRASRVARALGLTTVSTLLLPLVGVQEQRVGVRDAHVLLKRLGNTTGARSDVVQRLEQELIRKGR